MQLAPAGDLVGIASFNRLNPQADIRFQLLFQPGGNVPGSDKLTDFSGKG